MQGFFFFSSRRRHTRCYRDWSSDVCSSDLVRGGILRPDFVPVALQLLGDHHGIGSPDSLAELRLPDADRYGVVGRDDDPGVDLRSEERRVGKECMSGASEADYEHNAQTLDT